VAFCSQVDNLEIKSCAPAQNCIANV